jgi:hypothetical protein
MSEDSPLGKKLKLQDLKKEIEYIDRKIAHLEGNKTSAICYRDTPESISKLQRERAKKSKLVVALGGFAPTLDSIPAAPEQ